MDKIIIGLVGEIASGKGTAAKYLQEKYDASTYRFSTPLRDVLNRLYIENDRHNLQRISLVLRTAYGQDLFAKIITEDVKKSTANLIIVDGIRRLEDIKYLKELPNFYLVYITADINLRYERITSRDENTDDGKKTFADFQKDHEAETELAIPQIGAAADFKIENSDGMEKFYSDIENIIKQIKN